MAYDYDLLTQDEQDNIVIAELRNRQRTHLLLSTNLMSLQTKLAELSQAFPGDETDDVKAAREASISAAQADVDKIQALIDEEVRLMEALGPKCADPERRAAALLRIGGA